MTEHIAQLSELISKAAHTLQSLSSNNVNGPTFPELDDLYNPTSEEFRSNPDAALAANVIVEAAFQLIACVRPPTHSIFHHVCGHIKASALRVCIESNIVEALREGGSEGMHVNDIAKAVNLPPEKLGRILRYLATNHIFREMEPDVFCNNRISSVLDSKKSIKDIISAPEHKHDNTDGFVALMELFGGDLHKSSGYLLENLQDPVTSASEEPFHAPIQRAFNIDVPMFEWYKRSEQEPRRRRFMVAMQGTSVLQPEADLLKCMDWNDISPDSLVVEVGGGLGLSCLTVARAFPQMRFEIQDRQEVVSRGKSAWDAIDTKLTDRVHFRAHNYLDPQPAKTAAVFVLKHVIHNVSDPYALEVLKQLRGAAAPTTRLLLVDSIVPYACHARDNSESIDIASNVAPSLLPNFGAVNERVYISDLTMMLNLNAQERTLSHVQSLLEKSGWKINVIMKRDDTDSFMQPMTAVPV
ncbi:O-methyltransferase [Mycena maculata]|uniref:O-methyltransferase n=1 Tax=Mycena maculata TaxID=230809 RepID=A0AAD7KAX3_9AGAR|nr:O-methyltransferase [Mycena maculata]